MKKISLVFCACLLSVAAFALTRATGSFKTSCGEIWNYVVHYESGNNTDKVNRIAALAVEAENACQGGTGETHFEL